MAREKDGTLISGADLPGPAGLEDRQGFLDLQPDPAALRDLAARFREDADAAKSWGMKKYFLQSADEAESRAESVEASALWSTPIPR